MKAIVTIEIEVDEEILESAGVSYDEFIKRRLITGVDHDGTIKISHDCSGIVENVFTSSGIVSTIITRRRKHKQN